MTTCCHCFLHYNKTTYEDNGALQSFFFPSNMEKKAMATSCHRLLCCNNTMQENNPKKWRKGKELTFKLSFCPLIFGSRFKRVVLASIFALPLLAPSFALPLLPCQAFLSFDFGVSAKWGEVGRRGEVGKREKLWGKK